MLNNSLEFKFTSTLVFPPWKWKINCDAFQHSHSLIFHMFLIAEWHYQKLSFYLCVVCVCVCVCVCVLSCVQLFVTSWTVDFQAPLSMEFSRQKYWSGLPLPPPGDLPNPGIEPRCLASPSLAGRFFTTEPPGKSLVLFITVIDIWPPLSPDLFFFLKENWITHITHVNLTGKKSVKLIWLPVDWFSWLNFLHFRKKIVIFMPCKCSLNFGLRIAEFRKDFWKLRSLDKHLLSAVELLRMGSR